MKKKSLLTTNVYLIDQLTRDASLRKTVITSIAVEGAGKSAAKALKAKKTSGTRATAA